MSTLPCDFIGLQHVQNEASSLSLNKALFKQLTLFIARERWEFVFPVVIFTGK
jgi:hypothetical protein